MAKAAHRIKTAQNRLQKGMLKMAQMQRHVQYAVQSFVQIPMQNLVQYPVQNFVQMQALTMVKRVLGI